MLPYGWGQVLQNAIIKVNKPLIKKKEVNKPLFQRGRKCDFENAIKGTNRLWEFESYTFFAERYLIL